MAHSVFLGRIRQIGNDTLTNYEIASTSAYDSTDPAATFVALDPSEAILYDQALTTTVPPGEQFEHEGLLFTFDRRPFRFYGAIPKISAVFDESILNTSALEMWTHQSADNTWTLQNRILLNDPFRGTRSGRAKFFDMRLAVGLQGIDKVWITIAPAFGFTVVNQFIAGHLFGACHDRIETPGDCHADPTIDCLDPDDPTFVPPLDCTNFAPAICDLPPFDWPKIPPDAGGPTPPSEPPSLPLVDLCDPVALQAFKDSMTPDQLAYFEDLLAHTELPCLTDGEPQRKLPINDKGDGTPLLTRQPVEAYVNPKTGVPEGDPSNPLPPSEVGTVFTTNHFLFSNSERQAKFVAERLNETADVNAAYDDPDKTVTLFGVESNVRQQGLASVSLAFANLRPGMKVGIKLLGRPQHLQYHFPHFFGLAQFPNDAYTPLRPVVIGATGFSPPNTEIVANNLDFGNPVSVNWQTLKSDGALFGGTAVASPVGSIPDVSGAWVFTMNDWLGTFKFKPDDTLTPSFAKPKMMAINAVHTPNGFTATSFDSTVSQFFLFGFYIQVSIFVPAGFMLVEDPSVTVVATPVTVDLVTAAIASELADPDCSTCVELVDDPGTEW